MLYILIYRKLYIVTYRLHEVTSIRVKNVDGQRRIILIEQAKGKKDRIVSLSPSMLIMLREYYKKYKPEDYLFEGQFENEHLSERSIQQVMQNAKRKVGIKQKGSMHMLRHSFATHLLDKGIDVVFIQKLLGHNDIKTTLKYLHVTNKDLVHIISPLDDIEYLRWPNFHGQKIPINLQTLWNQNLSTEVVGSTTENSKKRLFG